MKKYSIIVSASLEGKYSQVFKSWELDEEGNEINVVTDIQIEKTLAEAMANAIVFTGLN